MSITLKNLNGFVSNTNEIMALEFETHKDLMFMEKDSFLHLAREGVDKGRAKIAL